MKSSAAAPAGERERLGALERFRILDTEPEERFDRVARLAARLFRTPIALVTFLDGHRQWHKARIGTTRTEIPREATFCIAFGASLIGRRSETSGRKTPLS